MPVLTSTGGEERAGGAPPAVGRGGALLGGSWDLALLLVTTLVLCYWNYSVTGVLSLSVPGVMLGLCAACYCTGRLLVRSLQPLLQLSADFPLCFLLGFFTVSTVLYLQALLIPLSLPANAALLALLLVLALLASGRGFAREPLTASAVASALPAVICVVVGLIAVTLWRSDSLNPLELREKGTVFRPWVDGFNHAAQIRMFSNAHGFATLQSIRYAGGAARSYHYASYIVPALISSLTPTTAYQAFNSFLAPMGLYLTALGAYSLSRGWWGSWPALFAALAVLAVPDAAQQGVHNAYLSYHWLLAATPGLAYGVAIIALAWLFMFSACRSGNYFGVAASYLVAAVCLVYKAHIFVANAFLLWVFPPLFLPRLSTKVRAAWFSVATLFFAAVMSLSQGARSLPLMKLDGSAMKPYLDEINQLTGNLWLQDLFSSIDAGSSTLYDMALGSLQLLTCSLGLGFLLLALAAWFFRSRVTRPVYLFPLLLVLNYLVMSLGLAYDSHAIGTSDELLHRPFVWLFFAVTLWLGGALYHALFGDQPPRSVLSRGYLGVAVAAALIVPLSLGSNIQKGPDWPLSNILIPKGLIACADYVRRNSDRLDLVQDSRNDPLYAVTALCDRQDYLVRPLYNPASGDTPACHEREREVTAFRQLADAAQIKGYARRCGLRWYLLDPQDQVAWPAALLDAPAYASAGYRVYKLY